MKNKYTLRAEYAKCGIDFVYDARTRVSFLKIMGAPTFVEGANGAQLTGWFRVPGGIKNAQDIVALSARAKDLYREKYYDNSAMLKYLDKVNDLPLEKLSLESKINDAQHKSVPTTGVSGGSRRKNSNVKENNYEP